MVKKQKIGSIIALALVPFLMATISFSTNATAASGNTGESDSSVMKKEQDGSVSKKEFVKHHQWMFEQNDANHDDYLSPDEMKNLHKMVKSMHERSEQKN